MDDLDGMDMQIMAHFKPRASRTASGRRRGETRPMHYSDGRKLRATGRTEQMNLKVRPDFKDRVSALARNANMLMVEYVERAIEAYAKEQD